MSSAGIARVREQEKEGHSQQKNNRLVKTNERKI